MRERMGWDAQRWAQVIAYVNVRKESFEKTDWNGANSDGTRTARKARKAMQARVSAAPKRGHKAAVVFFPATATPCDLSPSDSSSSLFLSLCLMSFLFFLCRHRLSPSFLSLKCTVCAYKCTRCPLPVSLCLCVRVCVCLRQAGRRGNLFSIDFPSSSSSPLSFLSIAATTAAAFFFAAPFCQTLLPLLDFSIKPQHRAQVAAQAMELEKEWGKERQLYMPTTTSALESV